MLFTPAVPLLISDGSGSAPMGSTAGRVSAVMTSDNAVLTQTRYRGGVETQPVP